MKSLIPQALSRSLTLLGAARHLLICSDYDGTLAPLAPRPEQARLLPGAFGLLHQLASLPDTRVAIISGRSRDDLRKHSGLDQPILLVGSHGAELPGLTVGGNVQQQSRLDALETVLACICTQSAGSWIERKPLSIALHVRGATPADAERALAAVRCGPARWPELRITEGKSVIELSLSQSGKGDAVRWLRSNWGTDPQVLYLGDDLTDEDAFGVLGPNDVGVKVGASPTCAPHRVATEQAALGILAFLRKRRTAQFSSANMKFKSPAILASEEISYVRSIGDIQAAVVNLVQRLAPVVPLARQSIVARKIAEVITSQPSTMSSNMFLRQSIIRGRTANSEDVVEGLAAWVTILFDLDNLQRNRSRALDLEAVLPGDDVKRLERALAKSRNGCILAVPHIGSTQLFAAHLRDRGFKVAFVYTMSVKPTPVEQWIHRGYHATHGTPIQFGLRNTGSEISKALRDNSIVCLVVDVYPSSRFSGIRINLYDDEFNFPPGPAKYAQSGTLVMPGFASRRDAVGFKMRILDPIEYPRALGRASATDFTQRLGDQITGFTAAHPQAYWLWHPIPHDPYRAIAERRYAELLRLDHDSPPNDEAVALAIEALDTDAKDLEIH